MKPFIKTGAVLCSLLLAACVTFVGENGIPSAVAANADSGAKIIYAAEESAFSSENEVLIETDSSKSERSDLWEPVPQEETQEEVEEITLSREESLLLGSLDDLTDETAELVGISKEEDVSNLSSHILAFYEAPFPSNDESKTNAMQACDYLSGTILEPGETFSYNDIIGKRTTERGFVEAPIILGGVMSTGIGGGICEISSILYNVCLIANMEVTERYPHTLLVPYVPGGLDAAISYGTKDFCFVNVYEESIAIFSGYDEDEEVFFIAFLSSSGEALLDGKTYVPRSEEIDELSYEGYVDVYQDDNIIETIALGPTSYAGIDDVE